MLNPGIEETKRKIQNLLGMMAWEKGAYGDEHTEEREMLFQDSGQADRALRLLKESRILDHFYQVKSLKNMYLEYAEKNKAAFSFEELFDEGWLIDCMGEWHFNISVRRHYIDMEPLQTEKEEQILTFLKSLAVHPYENEIWLEIPKGSDIEGMEEVTGVKGEGGAAYLDPYNTYWEKTGDILLGRWWDDIMELDETDEKGKKEKEQWLLSWKALRHCWRPDFYCEYTQELFGFCLEQLEEESKKFTWERMRHILRRRVYVQEGSMREQGYENCLTDIPNSPIACMLYVETCSNLFWNMEGAFVKLRRLYSLCVRQYSFVGEEYRRRFLKCLNHPWIYLQFRGFIKENIQLLSDCLGVADLYVAAARTVWEQGYRFFTEFFDVGERAVEELSQCVFEILNNELEWGDRDKWIQSMKDLMWYLGKESGWYFKDQRGMKKYMVDIHDMYMRWYREKILSEKKLHREITEYFYIEFKKSEERDVTRTFAEYVILEGLCPMKEAAEYLLDIYEVYIDRAVKEDVLISHLSWSFWQEPLWIHMMEELVLKESRIEEFLELLNPNMFQGKAEHQKKSFQIFSIRQAALVQLYMITILLLEVGDRLSDPMREKTEIAFTECFIGFQEDERCDLFDMEHIRLLRADDVVRRCMEILPSLGAEQRGCITFMMKRQPANKILLLLKYIQHQDIRKQWINILLQKADYKEHVFSLDIWAQVIDYMLEIGFRDGPEDGKLLDQAEKLLDRFREMVDERGKRLQKEFAPWIQSAALRIGMLRGDEEEILKKTGDAQVLFYQALIYLNREDLESLKKSAELFQKCIDLGEERDEEKSAAYINFFVACVRICTYGEAVGNKNRETYLQKAQCIVDEIRREYTLSREEEIVLYSHELYLYAELDDMKKFWTVVSHLPRELRYEYSCAQYLVQVYAKTGHREKAEKYLEELVIRYGETDELVQLQREISEASDGMRNVLRPVFTEESCIQKCRDTLNRIRNLTEHESALVHLQRDDLDDPEEVNLLKMVLDVTQRLSEYSNHLIFDGETAEENRYNKFIQILFEQKEKDIWDYYMKDQSQESDTGHKLKNKREGVGSIDLLICHNMDKVGLIEGIKIKYEEKEKLKKHIRKIAGYNYADMPTTFLLILADMENPGVFWREYEKTILPELIEETKCNAWHITEQIAKEQTEAVQKRIMKIPLYMCMTVHTCENAGKQFHLYHIMIDIRKAAETKEAGEVR